MGVTGSWSGSLGSNGMFWNLLQWWLHTLQIYKNHLTMPLKSSEFNSM